MYLLFILCDYNLFVILDVRLAMPPKILNMYNCSIQCRKHIGVFLWEHYHCWKTRHMESLHLKIISRVWEGHTIVSASKVVWSTKLYEMARWLLVVVNTFWVLGWIKWIDVLEGTTSVWINKGVADLLVEVMWETHARWDGMWSAPLWRWYTTGRRW